MIARRSPRVPRRAFLLLPAILALAAIGCGNYRPDASMHPDPPDEAREVGNVRQATPPPQGSPASPATEWTYRETPAVPEGLSAHRVLKSVTFSAGSSALNNEARGALGIALEDLQRNPKWHVLVVGHADVMGEKDDAERLAAQRARTVADHLEARGIDASRIDTQSLGSRYAQGDQYTREQVARDRRADVWVFM